VLASSSVTFAGMLALIHSSVPSGPTVARSASWRSTSRPSAASNAFRSSGPSNHSDADSL